jgi:hypothetical protein
MPRHWYCSGSYQVTISKVDVRRRLRTVVNVAILYNLHRLEVCDLSSAFRLVLTLSIGTRSDRTQLLVILSSVYSFGTTLEHPPCFRRIVVDSCRTSQPCCTSIRSVSNKCITDGDGTPILISTPDSREQRRSELPSRPFINHQKALVLSCKLDVAYVFLSLCVFSPSFSVTYADVARNKLY